MSIDNMVLNNGIYWPVQILLLAGVICGLTWWSDAASQRYPVGQSVPASVYTEPFDPCDPAYKFLQAPPKDWAEKFGNNERTALIHAVSELRVVVAAQSKRLLALEALHKNELAQMELNKVNEANAERTTQNAERKDPNEVKP